jgi:putative nucleotidyltransferase with HDIG domain
MSERVVVLDDEELAVNALSRVISRAGFETKGYTDPQKALAALPLEAPFIIISDYNMPSMDGISFFKKAREILPQAIRILCTGADEYRVAYDAINAGEVYRIVGKPWVQDEMLAVIRQAAEQARLREENARLTQEIQAQNVQLLAMNTKLEQLVKNRTEALLEGLVAALDYRDTETHWHSRRVSLFARRLAEQLGVVGPDLTTIEQGALLHDIGKIGVPDGVLLKAGPLTPEEWKEMKRHPELGWALLQHVDYLRPAAEIVLQHQEKFDGTGYPAQLKGDAIHVGARIFHVVDTLDAITSDRPYRKARGYADARAEIARCSGTQFDPRMVEAFMAIPEEEWARIRRIAESTPQPNPILEGRPAR